MLITLMKAKLHQARVTEAKLDYEGSITIDRRLMDLAGILPFEMVHVFDIANGARFVTYAIEGPAGSGVICVNGAAARLVQPGDRIIIVAYAQLDPGEVAAFRPSVVLLDEDNRVRDVIVHAITAAAPAPERGLGQA